MNAKWTIHTIATNSRVKGGVGPGSSRGCTVLLSYYNFSFWTFVNFLTLIIYFLLSLKTNKPQCFWAKMLAIEDILDFAG